MQNRQQLKQFLDASDDLRESQICRSESIQEVESSGREISHFKEMQMIFERNLETYKVKTNHNSVNSVLNYFIHDGRSSTYSNRFLGDTPPE
jgi:hypothetical protein